MDSFSTQNEDPAVFLSLVKPVKAFILLRERSEIDPQDRSFLNDLKVLVMPVR
jgi:hypothetical protein